MFPVPFQTAFDSYAVIQQLEATKSTGDAFRGLELEVVEIEETMVPMSLGITTIRNW